MIVIWFIYNVWKNVKGDPMKQERKIVNFWRWRGKYGMEEAKVGVHTEIVRAILYSKK